MMAGSGVAGSGVVLNDLKPQAPASGSSVVSGAASGSRPASRPTWMSPKPLPSSSRPFIAAKTPLIPSGAVSSSPQNVNPQALNPQALNSQALKSQDLNPQAVKVQTPDPLNAGASRTSSSVATIPSTNPKNLVDATQSSSLVVLDLSQTSTKASSFAPASSSTASPKTALAALSSRSWGKEDVWWLLGQSAEQLQKEVASFDVVLLDTSDPIVRLFSANGLLKKNEEDFVRDSHGLSAFLLKGSAINDEKRNVCYIVYDKTRAEHVWQKFIAPFEDKKVGTDFLMSHEVAHCMDHWERGLALSKASFPVDQAGTVGISRHAWARQAPNSDVSWSQYLQVFRSLFKDSAQRQYQERTADTFAALWVWKRHPALRQNTTLVEWPVELSTKVSSLPSSSTTSSASPSVKPSATPNPTQENPSKPSESSAPKPAPSSNMPSPKPETKPEIPPPTPQKGFVSPTPSEASASSTPSASPSEVPSPKAAVKRKVSPLVAVLVQARQSAQPWANHNTLAVFEGLSFPNPSPSNVWEMWKWARAHQQKIDVDPAVISGPHAGIPQPQTPASPSTSSPSSDPTKPSVVPPSSTPPSSPPVVLPKGHVLESNPVMQKISPKGTVEIKTPVRFGDLPKYENR